MIFNNNTTSLGSSVNVPMAEGYDCSYGAALALVEAAQNDYQMFKSMLNVEARALSLQESASYVNEAEYVALQEATASGIWAKIKELFSKLIAKIKAIFHTFMSKINNLFKTDKQMVKKYSKEVLRKTNLGNMEVKWCEEKTDITNYSRSDAQNPDIESFAKDYNDLQGKDSGERVDYYLNNIYKEIKGASGTTDRDSFVEDYHDAFFDDEETVQFKDTNKSMRSILDYIENSKKILDNAKHYESALTKKIDKFVSDTNKKANEISKYTGSDIDGKTGMFAADTYHKSTTGTDEDKKTADNKTASDAIEKANKVYDMVVAWQSAQLMGINCYMSAQNFKYKMYKAVFMKAIAANDKKLEESAIFADAFAEAAADEVSAVMDRAITKEELSKICNASTNVIDADVSDDPSKLTYGPDSYTPNRSYVATAGSVDSDINGTSESAYFGQMLY